MQKLVNKKCGIIKDEATSIYLDWCYKKNQKFWLLRINK